MKKGVGIISFVGFSTWSEQILTPFFCVNQSLSKRFGGIGNYLSAIPRFNGFVGKRQSFGKRNWRKANFEHQYDNAALEKNGIARIDSSNTFGKRSA